MQKVHVDYCNAIIAIALDAANSLWRLKVSEAIQPSKSYGKNDTFRLDAVPEIALRNSYKAYDRDVVFITEETGAQFHHRFNISDNRLKFPIVDISDPFDRSVPTQKFLSGCDNKNQTIYELFSDPTTIEKWEASLGSPASITGGCTAITRLMHGVPIFSVIINFVTKQLIVSCSAGIYCLDLPEDLTKVNLTYVRDNGKHIYFPDINHHGNASRFVTFLGKDDYKPEYKENLKDSDLIEDSQIATDLHYSLPGGPLRPLYLSTLHPDRNRPGLILSNGEKLGEWTHWLTFLRFGKKPQDDGDFALSMHEISGDRSNIRDGVMMSPTAPYSPFRNLNHNEGEGKADFFIVDVGMFPRFPIPSRIRSTLVLAPSDNRWIHDKVLYKAYRQIKMHPE